MDGINLREIYRDNTAQAIACGGLIPRLGRLFKREQVPLSEKIIYRHCGAYDGSLGASFVSRTRTLINGLIGIGRADRAEYLISSFAILPEHTRRKMSVPEWIERLGIAWGELIASAVSGNAQLINLKRCELRQFLAIEVCI